MILGYGGFIDSCIYTHIGIQLGKIYSLEYWRISYLCQNTLRWERTIDGDQNYVDCMNMKVGNKIIIGGHLQNMVKTEIYLLQLSQEIWCF